MTEMTNTLFRFTTMRTPALLDEDKREKYYVQFNVPGEGHFTAFIPTASASLSSRLQEGRDLADSFTPFYTMGELKTYVGEDFFNFAGWLAKNADALQTNLAPLESTGYDMLTPLTNGQRMALWDNLFYQLFMNLSAEIRERVIEVLVANHFITTFDSGTPDSKLAFSTLVIPKGLYGVYDLPSENEEEAPALYTKQHQQDLDNMLLKDKAARSRVLLNELKAAKERYDISNRNAFNSARIAYEADLSESMTEAITQNETSGETEYDFARVEQFSFTPAEEITTDVYNSLTAPSKKLYTDYNFGDLTSFDEIITQLNKEITLLDQQSFNKSSLGSKMLSINNVLLPVAEGATGNDAYTFIFEPVHIADVPPGIPLYKIFMAINTPFAGADAVAMTYKVKLGVGEFSPEKTKFSDQTSGNTLIIELFPEGILLPSGNEVYEEGTTTVEGTIKLQDNTILTFSAVSYAAQSYKGKMSVNAGPSPEEGGSTSNTTFIPSGFGIRRLGIADYRQVEQTTCCYVPGEVSHVENVMAREYKEKSNRRLRRSEETLTVERQSEREELTDTTSTDRYEMQQQTSSVINKDQSASVNTNSNVNIGIGSMTIGSNFASNTSQQQSDSQALTYAKDITQRAQERVVQKVREERVSKIIDEYEEQNKHGFDNRKGNQHVSGVYRWIDKIYKNRIFNYGKRLMYEFMIPQPAVFHMAAMRTISNSSSVTLLEKPVDPRTRDLKDYRNVVDTTAAAWAAVYNAEIESAPEATIRVSKSMQLNGIDVGGAEHAAKADRIELPEGYKAVSAVVNYMFYYHPNKKESPHILVSVGDKKTPLAYNDTIMHNTVNLRFDQAIYKEVGVGIEAGDMSAVSCNVVLNCECTEQYHRQWQLNTFNAIIDGYEKKLAAYNEALSAMQVTEENKGTNPLFYRQIENTVLRKNCITYLVGHQNLGKNFYRSQSLTLMQPDITDQMDQYASLAKFIEQAFEWDLISYTFYPFYWGNKELWQSLYQQEVNDPLFRSFLQSGMARVIATVRPGFEEAVMHYMKTGQVWNGGQIPVIGDDLYLSIIDELKNPTYYVEETWETRVPTTLTVIQSGSIGLSATGLPCCEEEEETGIEQTDSLLTAEEETP